ncbi:MULTISPECIES: hypothetical protein [Streptomyces]|uniref:ATP-binding protein n=1 Tax=Streptomyces pratensis (strain ATCC 33331 / IAF-45CD) TaxID=591167 RepID=A0A8D3WCI1_STRFA|nr:MULTISPECIES: hypothetical protein [Streptomyces]TPN05677.1 hypothetical protein FKO01_46185 [Mesorhizobium sp. B2-3-3]MDX3180409.1 hypothetical protein [Streptomyces sp. ME02-7008A-1]MDX3301150.1 hypothetical protein [Streptomyces sp. ME02-7008A]MEE1777469.1 hypothetical protein [Streptomyces sp. JV181]MYT49438.1 hypothetical protein [Streptomyces sp. SID7815]
MNTWRILTAAAAGSVLLTAAPAAAQADSFAPALTGTALTAATTGERTGTAVHEVAQETGLGQTASTATGLVETGAETLLARDQSVTD